MRLKEAGSEVAKELMPHAPVPIQSVGITDKEIVVYTSKRKFYMPRLDELKRDGHCGFPVRVHYVGKITIGGPER